MRTFFYPILPVAFTLLHVFHHIVAHLPYNATQVVRFLEVFKICFFFEKIDGFFSKKLEFFSKSLEVANLLQNAYQMVVFRKNVFSALIMRFFGKNQKTFKVGNIRKYDEKGIFFFKKERDHLSRNLVYKNGKPENMSVLAGRLVITLHIWLNNCC